MKSIIRLFKAVPIKSRRKKNPSKDIMNRTLKKGYILSPEVMFNYPDVYHILDLVEEELFVDSTQINSSLHKSWNKVKNSPLEFLLFEQLFHYITTYGYQAMDIYNDDTVFIPNERLDIPEIDEIYFTLTQINVETKDNNGNKIDDIKYNFYD